MTTTRDLAAEYYAACTAARHPEATLTEQSAAWAVKERLYKKSGYTLAVLDIDEAARHALYDNAK